MAIKSLDAAHGQLRLAFQAACTIAATLSLANAAAHSRASEDGNKSLISGTLIDVNGRPLSRWEMRTESEYLAISDAVRSSATTGKLTTTDHEGRFKILRPRGGFVLIAREQAGKAFAVFEGASELSSPGVYTVSPEAWRTSRVQGRVALPGPSLQNDIRIRCRAMDGFDEATSELDFGRFDFAALQPGRYAVQITEDGSAIFSLPVFLKPGESRDLGIIDPGEAGTIRFVAETPLKPVWAAEICSEDGFCFCRVPVTLEPLERPVRLAEGSYVVRIAGQPEQFITAMNHQASPVSVDPPGSNSVTFSVWVERSDPSTRVNVVVKNSHLAVVFRHTIAYRRPAARNMIHPKPDLFSTEVPYFLPGKYSVCIETGSGRRATEHFVVKQGYECIVELEPGEVVQRPSDVREGRSEQPR